MHLGVPSGNRNGEQVTPSTVDQKVRIHDPQISIEQLDGNTFPYDMEYGKGSEVGRKGVYNFEEHIQIEKSNTMYPRGEKWAQDRKLLVLIRLLLERMNFPLENMKDISSSQSSGGRGTSNRRTKRNGQWVGRNAEKPGVTETKHRELYKERRGERPKGEVKSVSAEESSSNKGPRCEEELI